MSNMPNAPLVYTIGVLRFPRIPEMGRFASAFLGAIRGSYPQYDEIALNFVTAKINLNPDAKSDVENQIDRRELKMFQFASPDRSWAFFLSEEAFGLHTSKYVDHDDFIRKFREGLEALLGIQDLGMKWIEAIGFRYVDLVKPLEGEPLAEYLQPWVLPPSPPESLGKMDLVQGMYVAQYKTEFGDLRFQSLRTPPMTLPPDLNNPLVQKNGWAPSMPAGDFALMDIDHGRHFSPLEKIDVDQICSKFLELRLASRKLFDQAGTDHAVKVWKGEATS
jgi:uncharacterized protein (TIGR04255 family)